jgi:predicted permease
MGGEFKFKSLRNNIYKVITVTVARLIIVPVVALAVFVYLFSPDMGIFVMGSYGS